MHRKVGSRVEIECEYERVASVSSQAWTCSARVPSSEPQVHVETAVHVVTYALGRMQQARRRHGVGGPLKGQRKRGEHHHVLGRDTDA
jgi:hypothetical protein